MNGAGHFHHDARLYNQLYVACVSIAAPVTVVEVSLMLGEYLSLWRSSMSIASTLEFTELDWTITDFPIGHVLLLTLVASILLLVYRLPPLLNVSLINPVARFLTEALIQAKGKLAPASLKGSGLLK